MTGSILVVAAIVTGAAGSLAVRTEAGERLQLVHADEFSIVFMPEQHTTQGPPAMPVEVRSVTVFETPVRLGQVSEWDVRISETRIDCQAGLIGDRRHKIFLGETPVDETVPPFRMQRPNGPEKAAILAHVCDPEQVPPGLVFDGIGAARVWASQAYAKLKSDAP